MRNKKLRNNLIKITCIFILALVSFSTNTSAQLSRVTNQFHLLYSKKMGTITVFDTVILEYDGEGYEEGFSFLLKTGNQGFMTKYLLRPLQMNYHPKYLFTGISIDRKSCYLRGIGVWDSNVSGKIYDLDSLQPTNYKSGAFQPCDNKPFLIGFKTYPLCTLEKSFNQKYTIYLFMNKPIDSIPCVKPYWFITKFVPGIGFVGFEEFDLKTNRRTAIIELVAIDGYPLNRIPPKYLKYFPKGDKPHHKHRTKLKNARETVR